MWLAILIVVLAIAMMLGPIMLMQPSKRQRRLAQLRTAAVEQGLQVRIAPMPVQTAHPGERVAVYYRCWPDKKRRDITWMLARQSISHGIHFAGEWDWVDERSASVESQTVLRALLPELPQSVLAIEATHQTIGLYWLEQAAGQSPAEASARLAGWLDRLAH